MRDVRLALGGAGPVAVRCREVETLLEGQAPSNELADQAGEQAFAAARPLAHNGYKIDMGRALVARAVEQFQG